MRKINKTKYGLFVPKWFADDNKVVEISRTGFYFRKYVLWFMYWKHPIYNFLVKINNYTRNRHFEENPFRKPRFDEVFEQLKKIARV